MIAFAYAQTTDINSALYAPLANGLCDSIREFMPGEEILLLTDDDTPVIKGVNAVIRIPKTMPLMTWRLKCHQVAHSVADEILFVEPDVRFYQGVMDVFNDEFDIAITTREPAVNLKSKRLNTPYTLGMTFSRSQEFWREAKMYCQTLDDKDQEWFGDMLSIAHVIDGGDFKVDKLDGAVFNHVINDPDEIITARAVHYKGKRKNWLFPLIKEQNLETV